MRLKTSFVRSIGRRLRPSRRWGVLPNRVHIGRGVRRTGHLPNVPHHSAG